MESVRERLKTLLIILLESLTPDGASGRLDRGLFDLRLEAAGVAAGELDDLLEWLQERRPDETLTLATAPEAEGSRGVRIYEEGERDLLTADAFGYLLTLRRDQRLSWPQMESLLQYASLVAETPLTRSETCFLLDQFIFTFPGRGSLGPLARRTGTVH